MKRKGYLMEQIADMENLRYAFWKAQRGKEACDDVISFRHALEKNLVSLQRELFNGNPTVGDYRFFKIHDPKERIICASSFRERVLHHAIMNICHDIFDSFQIFCSYASRRDKGVYAAIEQAKRNQHQYKWFLKMDVRKYFDSVNHNILKALLLRKFKDHKLISVFDNIIDSYESSPYHGLPIGNLTSQYFANHYLAIADHYIKEKMKVNNYVRYMDDMVAWSDDKRSLIATETQIRSFLKKNLDLTLKPSCINSSDKGLPFCGYCIFPNRMSLGKVSKKRFLSESRKYQAIYDKSIANESILRSHFVPMLSFVEHADSYRLRQKIFYGC